MKFSNLNNNPFSRLHMATYHTGHYNSFHSIAYCNIYAIVYYMYYDYPSVKAPGLEIGGSVVNALLLLQYNQYVTSHFKGYRQTSNISRTKCQNLNVSRLVLHLSLPNSLMPGVKSRMTMWLEQRRQALLQLYLSDQLCYCLLRCVYIRSLAVGSFWWKSL